MSKVTQLIAQKKDFLIAEAKKRGIWENFGQKEFRQVQDTFTLYENPQDDDALFAFKEWCENFDLSQLENF